MELFVVLVIIFVIYLAMTYVIRIRGVSSYRVQAKGNSTDKFLKNTEDLIASQLIKVKKKAQIVVSKSFLTKINWILLNEEQNILYMFTSDNELLITKNGNLTRLKYKLIVDNNSIIISDHDNEKLYNIHHEKNDFLFLNLVSTNDILIFANQTKYKDEMKKSIREIALKYYQN